MLSSVKLPRRRKCLRKRNTTGVRSATAPSGPFPENRRADAHMGCPLADRGLEVVAHPHAERGERVAPGNPGQQLEMGPGIGFERREAHQPDDLEIQFVPTES